MKYLSIHPVFREVARSTVLVPNDARNELGQMYKVRYIVHKSQYQCTLGFWYGLLGDIKRI